MENETGNDKEKCRQENAFQSNLVEIHLPLELHYGHPTKQKYVTELQQNM